MDIKPDGTVATVGSFQHTVDFDPGPDEVLLVSNAGAGYVVTNTITGATTAFSVPFFPQDVAFDVDGNLVVVGYFTNTVDIDPSAAVVSLTSAGYEDGVVAHYTPGGTLLSYAHPSSAGYMRATQVLIDTDGNWVVGGSMP